MSLSQVRKVCLSGFLFPRHMAPALMRPMGAKEQQSEAGMAYQGFVRISGRSSGIYSLDAMLRPDLLDILRMRPEQAQEILGTPRNYAVSGKPLSYGEAMGILGVAAAGAESFCECVKHIDGQGHSIAPGAEAE